LHAEDVKLYRYTWPDDRDEIERDGLRGGPPFENQVFSWEKLEQAHAYRRRKNASGWGDIWSFEDEGRSRPSPASGDGGMVLDGKVPPDKLIRLEHDAYLPRD
jgi:hypothetical protein